MKLSLFFFLFFAQETWDFGCILPKSLSIQVLWARQGLVDLPQNYILGAKYIFKCETFKVKKIKKITQYDKS